MLETIAAVDLRKLLLPDVSLLEIFIRGTITYLALFLFLRWLRRPTGQLGIADVLLITVLADAAQNAMSGPYQSVSSGLWLILTIIFWDQVIDRLAYRVPILGRWIDPPPIELVSDGVIHPRNLERLHISRDELQSHLRQHGVDELAQVSRCCLEGDGHISVITRRKRDPG